MSFIANRIIMAVRIIPKSQQAYGAFNNGQIIENKPIGFPQDGGFVRPFSNLFYWAKAEAVIDSTIGLHPHQGFEIMSFVLEGAIRHYDTKHEEWRPLKEGDVQIIRAGNGIQHAEHMEKGAVMFQIWVDPDLSKTLSQPASYDDYTASSFPVHELDAGTQQVLIGDLSPLELDTDPFEVSRFKLRGTHKIDIQEGEIVAAYVIDGSGQVNGQTIETDDFIIAYEDDGLDISVDSGMDLFVVKTAQQLPYTTYAERSARFQ